MKNGSQNKVVSSILIAWLIVGSLDLLAAIIMTLIYKGNIVKLLQFIASGFFGNDAFADNAHAVYGLLFHYFIALSWTFLFFVAYPKLKALLKNNIVIGIVYGLFVWVMMNRLVIPLSEITPGPFNLRSAIIGASILIVAIGLPLSFLAERYYSKVKSA